MRTQNCNLSLFFLSIPPKCIGGKRLVRKSHSLPIWYDPCVCCNPFKVQYSSINWLVYTPHILRGQFRYIVDTWRYTHVRSNNVFRGTSNKSRLVRIRYAICRRRRLINRFRHQLPSKEATNEITKSAYLKNCTYTNTKILFAKKKK